jgi:hypothetical protein
MATVWPDPAVADGRLYAGCNWAGPSPDGLLLGVTPFAKRPPVATRASQ